MSVLAKDEIKRRIKNKDIKITPYQPRNIGAGSIDLTLANEFRVFDAKQNKIEVSEKIDYKKLTKVVKGPVELAPGEFMLGITKEIIKLPENVCGLLSGRSRFARLGLIVHATASFIQPGINNKQVLEIYNLSKKTLILKKGLKICQLTLVETIGKAKYQGKYKNQNNL